MKLTTESIGYINLFETITGAKVRDCFYDKGVLIFLVEEGNVKMALGKNNSNMTRISRILKKNVDVVAFSNDVRKFVSNLIYPTKADISLDGRNIKIKTTDTFSKGKIFGRGRENLKRIKSIVKNYFDIDEIFVF